MSDCFTTPIEVRFRDLDAMGHVNNAVFFTYFEEGRKKLFYSFSKIEDPSAFEFILAHVECDFVQPIKLNTKAILQMRVKEVGRKSFKLSYEIVDAISENNIYARGESVQVCFNYKEGKSMEIPEELKEWLSTYIPG